MQVDASGRASGRDRRRVFFDFSAIQCHLVPRLGRAHEDTKADVRYDVGYDKRARNRARDKTCDEIDGFRSRARRQKSGHAADSTSRNWHEDFALGTQRENRSQARRPGHEDFALGTRRESLPETHRPGQDDIGLGTPWEKPLEAHRGSDRGVGEIHQVGL
jgi:hypothetical protein